MSFRNDVYIQGEAQKRAIVRTIKVRIMFVQGWRTP